MFPGGIMKSIVGVAMGWVLCGWGPAQAAYDQMADSSIGKSPYLVIASLAGGVGPIGRADSFSRSFLGKPSSIILSEGPPPRLTVSLKTAAEDPKRYFYVYSDQNSKLNHFQPVGYMGAYENIRVDSRSSEDPAAGLTCVKVTYAPTAASRDSWAGVYWLDPKSNWGFKPGGFNLSKMIRLTFWARGAKGGEQVALFKAGGVNGTYPDSGTASIGPVLLTAEWRQYVIDLREVDLSKVSGGFAWSTSQDDNVGPLTFYLDDIRYER